MIERVSYVVYYKNDISKLLKNEKINITYISKKNNYLVFFMDKKDEKEILQKLKNIKEITNIEKSYLTDISVR